MNTHQPLYPGDEEMNTIRKEAFDFVGVGLYRYKFDGTIIFMDHNMLRQFEIDDVYPDPSMVVGKRIEDLFIYTGPRGRVREEVRKTGYARNMEYPYKTLKGTQKWALHDSYLVRDPQTGEEAIQSIVQDISERKRLEEQLRRRVEEVETLMDVAPVALWVCNDPHCYDIIGNRTANTFYEAEESENVSANVSPTRRFFRDGRELAPDELPMQEAAIHNYDVRNVELDVLLPSGRWLTMWGSASPLRDNDGRVRGCVGGFVDITKRKHAEEELRHLNETLEQRVHDRTAALEAANKELEAFSYSVSHDLRAPLRSIDGFTRILLEKYLDHLDTQGQDYLTRVRSAAQRMSRLIDDMLKLSRLGRVPMRWETVNLSALATTIIDELRQRDPVRQVAVDITPDLLVTGDAALLRIVLDNLLGNAWKFTSKREEACITVGTITMNGERIYFVRDNGAGFDMSYADKLFTPFQRLHTEEEFPGTGIGLAIVQRIIARHGGRVWAQGEEGKGATIYFTLGGESDG